MENPIIIQGGMGVGVSGWRLARAVAQTGQLGVVSGTLLGVTFARTLQMGDPGGHMRRALDHFPCEEVAERVWRDYFVPGGIAADAPFKPVPMPTIDPNPRLVELTVVGNFCEVFLAREGHSGVVGINLLEKVQLATIPSLFGAMLAGVDYVLMGAGIPRAIPGILDSLARGEPAEMRLDVAGSTAADTFKMRFDPADFGEAVRKPLRRPRFIAIVSSVPLATTLARKSTGRVDGFVVEGEVAGGHNAPPRGALQLTTGGEPVYGQRDAVDLEKIRQLGLPFWLAGAFSYPKKLVEALAAGAAGVQVGTAFAFCEESGILPDIKRRIRDLVRAGAARVFTDPVASPTGFPFKVAQLAGSLSEAACYHARRRICDLGYLRQLFRKPDGTVGYRCPGEPDAHYIAKGGDESDLKGRKCLCNGLAATVGFGQRRREAGDEPPLITAGRDLASIARFFTGAEDSYRAADVVRVILGELADAKAAG